MNKDEEKQLEEKALSNIEKNGCHILHITEDEDSPSFTYSIGIQKCTGKPDIIVTGLDRDMSHFLINEYNYRIKDGETFEVDKFYEEFLDGAKITFKEVEKKHYPNYFGWGHWFYKGDYFKVLHLIWPDTNGAWPWEKKASKGYRWHMPPLYARK